MAKDISANVELEGRSIKVTPSLSDLTLAADADIRGLVPIKGKSVQSDWNEADSNSNAYIQNKPSIASGTGTYSVIEGCISGNNINIASAPFAHAEGKKSTSAGSGAHTEGAECIASGSWSHAEGRATEAKSRYSHSEGFGTIANGSHQHVQGCYNVEDVDGIYTHIVGNGVSDIIRHNAHTLDRSGNAWYQGKVTAEGTPTEDNDLVPKSYADKFLNAFPVDTATGSVASFSDGAELPLKSLTVGIDPVQDLHGYANPWPAGGGKNILAPVFYDGIGYNVAVGTAIAITEATGVTESGNTYTRTVGNWGGFGMRSPVLANGTYHLYADLASDNMRSSVYVLNADMTVSRNLGNQGSGTSRTIDMLVTLSGDETYLAFNCISSTAGDVSISTPMVALSDTKIEWTPYSNICPIRGWDEANVVACGKNLLDASEGKILRYASAWDNFTFDDLTKTVTITGGALFGFIVPVKPSTQYTYSLKRSISETLNARIREFKTLPTSWAEDGNFIVQSVNENIFGNPGTQQKFTFTTNAETNYVVCCVYHGNSTPSDTLVMSEFMLCVDESASYEPYHGTPITIDFGTTVYGGVLDVLSGVLTVNKASFKVSDAGWTRYGTEGNYKFYHRPSNIKAGANTKTNGSISSAYPIVPFNDLQITPNAFSDSANSTGRISVYDSEYANSTVEEFVAGRADVRFVYPLATSVEIQLTPHEANSLLGTNTIYADTGNTSVEYRADPTLYIQRKIAEAISALT